jgi:hypothetical protein
MKKLSILLFLVAIHFVCFSQIGAKTQQNKIEGVWMNNDMGYQMLVMLGSKGSGEFDGEVIKYSTQANKLVITQEGVSTTYAFNIENNSLTLSGGDLDSSITFKRNGGVSNQAEHSNVSSSNASEIIGTWSDKGELITFSPSGQCTYLGQNYPYSITSNQLTFQTSQGNIVMAYIVKNNQLTLSANGKDVVYSKGNNSNATQTNQNQGDKRVAQELVGKWCYVNVTTTNSGGATSDECITLKADGTYEYYSERSMSTNTDAFWAGTNSQNGDRGTWTFDGNRIYNNSQTNGQGSYQLQKVNHPKNGDPMIVLDGKAYVTYYQKSPW